MFCKISNTQSMSAQSGSKGIQESRILGVFDFSATDYPRFVVRGRKDITGMQLVLANVQRRLSRIGEPVGLDVPRQTIIQTARVTALLEHQLGEPPMQIRPDFVLALERGQRPIGCLMP